MDFAWGVVSSVITAVAGLGGVFWGGHLTHKREEEKSTKKEKKDTVYLAVLVSAHLNRLIASCAKLAGDDGTIRGEPAGENRELRQPVFPDPEFNILDIDVDWKVLPSELIFEILALPMKIEQLQEKVSSEFDLDDFPEFYRAFWVRQHGFAELGLEAALLESKLRELAGFPSQSSGVKIFDFKEYLIARRDLMQQKLSEN